MLFHRLFLTSLVLGLAACAVPAEAQSVGERLANDEQRIAEGWRSGQLTPPEYNELQGRHAAIERTRAGQFVQFGGHIPPGLYNDLLAREDALSRSIFTDRHNGATPNAH